MSENSAPSGETYQLTTIADLVMVPPDRLQACFRDLEYALNLAHLALGEDASPAAFGVFRWTDDGDHSIDMTSEASGEPILSLNVTATEKAEGR